MLFGRFERYTIRHPSDHDDVVIVLSQWRNGLAVGLFSLLMFGVPLGVPFWWGGLAPRDVEYWPWSCVGLGLGGFAMLLGSFNQRWTVSRASVTYSSTIRRAVRTVLLRDLAALAIHYDPPGDSSPGEASGPSLRYCVRFRTKDGDEHALSEFRFVRRRVFEEFLIALHAVLPIPIDDPGGLLPKVDKPSDRALA